MKRNSLFISLLFIVVIYCCGCKKKFDPNLPDDVASNDFAGALSGYNSMDLRTIFAVSDGYTSSQKNIILDTNFLFIPNLHVLTPHVVVNITENGTIYQTTTISLIDTSGKLQENLPMTLSGKFTGAELQLEIQLTVNEKDYCLNFSGKRGDYASLIDGIYRGTFALGSNTSPNDSLRVKWISKSVTSLIANTKIGDTPIVTDEEVIVTKEVSYCMVNAQTTMDIELVGVILEDIPTEIVGKIKADKLYLEVMFTIPYFPVGLTMTFTGIR